MPRSGYGQGGAFFPVSKTQEGRDLSERLTLIKILTRHAVPVSQPPFIPGPQLGQPEPPPIVTVSPGGLSSGAHAVHLVVSLFTCGLWLPFYVLHLIVAPRQHVSVSGTPAQLAAQPGIAQPGRPIRFSQTEKVLLFGGAGVLALLLVVAAVLSAASKG